MTQTTENQVIILEDGKFPSFFINHSQLIEQLEEWLEQLATNERNNIPPKPALILEPPKSGKTAMIERIAPLKIKERFPEALICSIDFDASLLNTEAGTSFTFAATFHEILQKWCKKNIKGKYSRNIPQFIMSDNPSKPLTQIIDMFDYLNDYNKTIFFLWDEIQVWLSVESDKVISLFDLLTFRKKYRNLKFCVTGSSMVFIYKTILSFSSNGDYWPSAAHIISSVSSKSNFENIQKLTVNNLKKYHPDVTPDNLLEWVLDPTPAMLCYFCSLHESSQNSERCMSKTNAKVNKKLLADFDRDLRVILADLYDTDNEIFRTIINLAAGTNLTVDDRKDLSSILGNWDTVFTPLLEDHPDGFVQLRGYYGTLIANSVTSEGKLLLPRKLRAYPFPRHYYLIIVVNEALKNIKDTQRRTEADDFCKMFLKNENITDFKTYQPYIYFCEHKANSKDKEEAKRNYYLHFFRKIRNVVGHPVGSLEHTRDLQNNMPHYVKDWTIALFQRYVNISVK